MLNKDFYLRKADIVARELLGKVIVRSLKNRELKTKIVETEAYFDENDPASRACKGGDLRKTMKSEAGTILVYGIHNQWLFNVVTGKQGEAQAVLLRAVEPLNFQARTSGPGLLTKALQISKEIHNQNIINNKDLRIIGNINQKNDFEIQETKRVGVREDLPNNLRFYIKGNKFVSKR